MPRVPDACRHRSVRHRIAPSAPGAYPQHPPWHLETVFVALLQPTRFFRHSNQPGLFRRPGPHLNSVRIGTAATHAVPVLFSLCVALVRSGIDLRARRYKENRNEEIADYEYIFSGATVRRLLRGTARPARTARRARPRRSARPRRT